MARLPLYSGARLRDDTERRNMDKPFHLLTPAERTALRIAQNRAIAEKIEENKGKAQRPPSQSTGDFVRATPEERGKLGTVIRKVQS